MAVARSETKSRSANLRNQRGEPKEHIRGCQLWKQPPWRSLVPLARAAQRGGWALVWGAGILLGLSHGRCPQTCSPTRGSRIYNDPQGPWGGGDPRAKQPPRGHSHREPCVPQQSTQSDFKLLVATGHKIPPIPQYFWGRFKKVQKLQ